MTMNYNFQKDMKAIREILGMTQEEFAEKIGVEQAMISRNELGKNLPSSQLMERVYQFAFDKKIQINQFTSCFFMVPRARLPVKLMSQ